MVRGLNLVLVGVFLSASQLAASPGLADEFIGPFASWANVKTEYGAVGDGKADDTAAIQEALLDVRRQDSPKKVLYFPAGTYRITATLKLDRLSHHEPLGMSIAGEDPERTILRWDGPEGGNMFRYNAWYASVSRLTFDGAGKAKTAIEHGESFSTANEFADLMIKDVQFGIEAGVRDGIAETAVLRCRFYRCAKAAVSIQNFNSLDWYLWDCWFEDCGIGVTNEFGAGNFHVYQSVFLRSADADITIRHTGYFSFVGNVSIGSRRFFHAKRASNWKDTETWGSQATLQDNRVIDPCDPTPILIENNGPNMLVDNIIRARADGPLLVNEPPADKADLICVGNRWTAEQALRVNGRLTDLDNKRVKAEEIPDVKPAPAAFAPRADRPVIEVKPGADAAALQAAIRQAAAMKGKRPVVHLPKATYTLRQTVVIPAGCDVQLVGDGPEDATQLNGTGGADPLLRVQGPSHATFRNLLLSAGNKAVGLLVENCDQPGARIFAEQLNVTGYEYGLATDGLARARFELRDANHNGIQATGAGPDTRAWVALFAGSSGRTMQGKAGVHLYDVQNGARLLVRDIWYEGDAWSLMNLAGSGQFAYHGGFVAPYTAFDETVRQRLGTWEADVRKSVTALQFDGFRGKLAFTLISSNGADLRVKPPSPDLRLCLLGFLTNRGIDLGRSDARGQVIAEHTRVMRGNATGTDAVGDVGKADPAFIREMLKPLREVKPQPPSALGDDVTDVRFYRVWASGSNGVRIQAK